MRAGEVLLGITLVPFCNAHRISTCPVFLPTCAATACNGCPGGAGRGWQHRGEEPAALLHTFSPAIRAHPT